MCIALRAEWVVPEAVAFVKSQGRMKYVRPIYRDLFGGTEQMREAALRTFKAWEENYHPIARKMLAQDLKLA